MEKFFRISLIAAFAFITLTSCEDDDDEVATPVELGSQVFVTNTFQSEPFGIVDETLIQDLDPSIVVPETAVEVVDGVDLTIFSYEVDVTETSITFSIPEDAESDLFRVIEAGTYDRYYFEFTPTQNINGGSSSTTGVSAYLASEDSFVEGAQFVIEISEGFDFRAGISFTVDLF